MFVLTSATFLTFLLFFPFTVVGRTLTLALAPVDSLALGLTFVLGFLSSESLLAASLLIVALLEEELFPPPLDVNAAAVCPSSTKLMSSGETWAPTPTDQLGCLKIWIVDPSEKDNFEHLIHWNAQRIGVMKTKVTASSPRSSTVVSRDASNRLMTHQHCQQLESMK